MKAKRIGIYFTDGATKYIYLSVLYDFSHFVSIGKPMNLRIQPGRPLPSYGRLPKGAFAAWTDGCCWYKAGSPNGKERTVFHSHGSGLSILQAVL